MAKIVGDLEKTLQKLVDPKVYLENKGTHIVYNLEESLQKLVDPMVQLQNTSTYVVCDRGKFLQNLVLVKVHSLARPL